MKVSLALTPTVLAKLVFLVLCLSIFHLQGFAQVTKSTNDLKSLQENIVNIEEKNSSLLKTELPSYQPLYVFDDLTNSGYSQQFAVTTLKRDQTLSIVGSVDEPLQFVYIKPSTLKRERIETLDKLYQSLGNIKAIGISPNNRYALLKKSGSVHAPARYIVLNILDKSFYDLNQLIANKDYIYEQGKVFRGDYEEHAISSKFFRGEFPVGFNEDNSITLRASSYSSEAPENMRTYVEVTFAPIDEIIKLREQNIAYNPKVVQKFIPKGYRTEFMNKDKNGAEVQTWKFSSPNVILSEVIQKNKTIGLLITDRDNNRPIAVLDAETEISPHHIFFDKKNKRTFVFNTSTRNQLMIWDYYPE